MDGIIKVKKGGRTMKKRSRALSLAYTALGTVLICLGGWISVPSPIPFTLQTLAIFLVLCLLGGTRGFTAVLLYVVMGALGLPVFSGFRGGAGVLLGATGGYITGFLAAALVFWAVTARRDSRVARMVAMAAGLLVCYAAGSLWYAFGYASSDIGAGVAASLMQCVLPFVIPDALKLVCALLLAEMIKRRVRIKL